MGFIGGGLRQQFVTRIKDADPGRLLAVPIDVGRHSAAAMVCDFWGEVIAPPFDFDLDENGFKRSASHWRAPRPTVTRRGRASASSRPGTTTVRCRRDSRRPGSR
jgi:hypothetical protein